MSFKVLSTAVLALASLSVHATATPQASRPAKAAQATEARSTLGHYNLEKKSLAISGYDPVSYFPEGGGKGKEGKKKIETVYRGVRYRFRNEQNKKAFLLTPERFEPAYGGWCSYAMSQGKRVEVDPDSFVIQEGRLLLFYDGFLSDTRKSWKKEGPEKLMPIADAEWTKFSTEKRSRVLRHFNLNAGVAIAGHDPVAYFSKGAAAGDSKYSTVHQGITYRFANAANLAAFTAGPSKYEAQYGGWCAWAMAQGKKVAIDPNAFAVHEGKLYLFYNAAKRDEWLADKAGFVGRANKAWSALK